MDGVAPLGEQNQGLIGVLDRGSSTCLLSGLVSTEVSHSFLHFPSGMSTAVIPSVPRFYTEGAQRRHLAFR